MPGTVLGPGESVLDQTHLDPALLKLLFHQGSCRLLLSRHMIKQVQFVAGAWGEEDRVEAGKVSLAGDLWAEL